ncbi:Carbonic anhydrase [Tolypocladium paradoxum]|uniref:Carbonic anhydrase n=1 Tax=Tolypocladium paradoxum TaxID=94208 RepID=A0A2S4LAQ8_9HYPO|nr:Carbonic anhydrase [Tolypocladium paradoxum]
MLADAPSKRCGPLSFPSSCWEPEITIVHHPDCGMLNFSDADLRSKARQDLGEDVNRFSFLPFSDLEQSVVDDVNILKKSPLVLDVPITGYIYDVKTGKVSW